MRLTALAALLIAASCAQAKDKAAGAPNAPGQTSASAGQTRAAALPDGPALTAETVVDGLVRPWALALLPGGDWLVTERPGRLRHLTADGTLSGPIAGLPAIDAGGQGGLLDVMVGPDFADTRRVWISFTQPRSGGNATAVATGVLAADNSALRDVATIWQQNVVYAGDKHFGSRLLLDRDGALVVTTGDRSDRGIRERAQDLQAEIGKVIRIDPRTGAPRGAGAAGAAPTVWSWGHRNIQSAAIGPDGTLWTIEHGPKGGDELNAPAAGRNYGWPVISYGVEYSGAPVGEGVAKAGLEQPVYYWDPVIGPSGMAFYDGAMFPEWQGQALVGGLADRALVRLAISGGRVVGEARHFRGEARIRDVAVAPDGAIMLLTDAQNGAVVRVSRR